MNTNAPTFTHADRKDGIWKTVITLLVIIAVLVAMFVWRVLQPRILSPKELYNAGAVVFDTPREISEFTLLNKQGDAFVLDDIKEKWSFVFFGFTHCPDICPTTVALFNQLGKEFEQTEWADSTQFVLVSVDPARDTPEKMQQYVNYFNPDIRGVTGDFLTIKRLANQLNIAFAKVVTDHEAGEYTVDHSGAVALINADGHYQGFYKPPLDLEKIALTYQSIRLKDRRDNS